MKLLSILLVIFAAQAHAAAPGAQKISLTCDAHELAPGSAGRVGQVVIAASTEGKYINSAWNLEITWKGYDSIVAPGSVCGVGVTAPCEVYTSGTVGGTFHIAQVCGNGGAFDTRGLPHHTTDVSLSLTNVGDYTHGHFYCAAHDARNYANIELANCR